MAEPVAKPRYKLLVVDDSPENIDILCELLQADHDLRVATNGARALEIVLGENPPDLVLLDAVMPGMDGFEVCRRIKAHAARQHIPVLFVTSLDQTEEEAKALSIGAADYITKPFSAAVVLARVRTHLALFDHANQLERTVRERTRALSDREEQLRTAVSAASLGVYDLDLVEERFSVSPEHIRALSIDPAGLDGSLAAWTRRIHEDDLAVFERTREDITQGRVSEFNLEYRHRSASGHWLWLLSKGRIVEFDDQGRPRRALGAMVDITQHKHQAIRLQQAATVFMNAAEAIVIGDATGAMLEVNEAFMRMTGYTRAEAVGHSGPRLLDAEVQSSEFYARRERIIVDTGHWSGEVWLQRKNGEKFLALVTVNASHQTDGSLGNRIIFVVDLTEQQQHKSQLERMAHYDTLTNLPNRSLLRDRLQQAMAQARRQQNLLAVVLFDLDDFKSINDCHGPDVGDQLLITLAQRLSLLLREGDTLSRVGGDEFIAILVGLESKDVCEATVERLLQAAAAPVNVGGHVIQATASAGVTLFPQDDADIDVLLRHADQAMYLAKQSGKNRCHFFDIDEDRAVRTQRETVDHIEHGLRASEFILYYQPKVNMLTGEVVGAEALVRWRHPQRGILSPATFLPVIEGHALSIDLGEWVIDAALSQMAQWDAQGLTVAVSVNIGALQLQQRNFPVRLQALLDQHPSIDPARLELEILETSALADIAWASEVIRACQSQGVRFALDDFGTGYSSLSYLKRLPCEVLKIDQSFVRDMLADPDDLSIVQTVVGLAAAFRREAIAEGVETAAHGKALLALGCVLAQGYGIARPMPAAAFPDWVRTWQPDPSWG